MGVRLPSPAPRSILIVHNGQPIRVVAISHRLVLPMQITETSNEGLSRAYQVTIADQDIQGRVTARLTEIAKTVSLPGFRPGKVPMAVLRQRYAQSVLGEVLEDTVNKTSADVLAEKGLRPALQPKIEIESFGEGQDLVYKMSVEILPEIALPDLTALAFERLAPEVADAEIDEALTRIADRNRKTETVTDGSPAAEGDVLVIDFVGSIDGTEFPGGSAKGTELELGSNRFIPGFEAQLVGAKAGDHVSVTVTFPADYGAEHLAGKDAVFAVDVTEVKRKLPSVIDDALAETVGLENLESLRSAVRDQILNEYNQVSRQKLKRDLLDKLAETVLFESPAGMVEIEFKAIWEQYEAELTRAKENKTYKEEEAKPEDETKAEYRAIADRRVRLGLLLAEIGRANDVQVTQDEVNRAVVAQARQYPGQEKAVFDYYRNHPEALGALRAPIYEDKVVDFIIAQAKISDKSVPAKDLLSLAGLDEDGDGEIAA